MSTGENYSMVSRQRTANKPKRNSKELSLEGLRVSFAESLIHCAVDWTWQKCSKDRLVIFDRHDENDPYCFSSSNDDDRSETMATLSTTNSRLSRIDLMSSKFIRVFVTLDRRLSFDDDRDGAALLEDFGWFSFFFRVAILVWFLLLARTSLGADRLYRHRCFRAVDLICLWNG